MDKRRLSEFRRILFSKLLKVKELKLDHQLVTYVTSFSIILTQFPEVQMQKSIPAIMLLQGRLLQLNHTKECSSSMAVRDSSSLEDKDLMRMYNLKSSLKERKKFRKSKKLSLLEMLV